MHCRLLFASIAALLMAAACFAQSPVGSLVGEELAAEAVRSPFTALTCQRVWATAEYLVWGTRTQDVPLLVGTIPDQFVRDSSGALASDGSVTRLFPTDQLAFKMQSGVRARVGANVSELFGVDAGGFILESTSSRAFFASPGSPSLVRTYTRALDGTNTNLYSALPGSYAGSVGVAADTRTWGLDANARLNWYRLLSDRTDLLLGARYVNVTESLAIHDRSDLAGGSVVNTVLDVFRTNNNIYVGQAGFHAQWWSGRWSFDLMNTFGVGGANQRVEIFGQNTLTGAPPEQTGLYTQQGMVGVFERNRFVATNEFGFRLGFHVTQRVSVNVGYTLLWVSSVVRPGLAVDPVINDSNIRFVADPPADPNSRRPAFDFNRASSDFWVQGLTLGVGIGF